MKKILTCLTLAAAATAHASDWMTADTALQATLFGLNWIDYRQTEQIAHQPDKFFEYNAAMGANPQPKRVRQYFAAVTLAEIGIAFALPPDYRHVFQGTLIGLELAVIGRNKRLGLKVEF